MSGGPTRRAAGWLSFRRLCLVVSLLMTGSALTTVALAAGFNINDLKQLPLWEIALVAFPFLGITVIRLRQDR